MHAGKDELVVEIITILFIKLSLLKSLEQFISRDRRQSLAEHVDSFKTDQ